MRSPTTRRCRLHSRPVVASTLVADLGDVPDLLEDLHPKALVVGIVAGKVAIVFSFGVGARAAKDEFFPITHLGRRDTLKYGRAREVR